MLRNNKFIIVFLSFAIPFLMATGVDLYAPSLPAVTHYFATTASLAKLTIGFYLLGYGCSPIFCGILSDSYGRRKVLLSSIFIFFIGAIFAIIAPNIYFFLGIRLLQGMAIGGIGLVVNALLTDSFSGIALAKMSSYMTISWALGQIIGPFIGGHFQQYFGWQANFCYFALYGLTIFVIVFFWLPETNRYLHSVKMTRVFSGYLKILRHRLFISSVLIMTLLQSIATIFSTIAPFVVQDMMKYSPLIYGYIGLTMGASYFLGGLSNRFLLNFVDPSRITCGGLVGAVIISWTMIILSLYLKLNLWVMVIPSALLFYCNGMVFPNCLGKCLGFFPENAGVASAVLESFFGIGTFCTALLAITLKGVTQLPIAVVFACLSIVGLIIRNFNVGAE